MYRFFSALGSDALVEILKQSNYATAIYTGSDLKIQLVNDAMVKIWGKDHSVHGKTFEEALPEMKGQPFTDLLKNVWHTGRIFEAHDMPATLEINGEMVTSYFDFVYKPIINEQNEVYCILHTATDVTERVMAKAEVLEKEERLQQINEELAAANEEYRATNEELNKTNDTLLSALEQLAFSEERTRQLIKNTPVGLALLHGPDMIIETANPEMLRIWGHNRDTFVGRPLFEIFPILKGQVFSDVLKRVYATGETVKLEEVVFDSYVDDHEEIKYVNLHFHPVLNDYQQTDGVMVTVIDISQLVLNAKQLEQNEISLQEFNEELTALNEELQTSNEELASLNEEYQATNEQLDAANQQVFLLNEQLKKENTDLIYDNKEFQDNISHLGYSNQILEYRNQELQDLNDKVISLNQQLSESQKSFSNLIAQAPVAMMLVKGEHFIITMINANMLKLIGRDTSIIGKPLFEVMPELNGQPAANRLIETFNNQVTHLDYSNAVVINREGHFEEGYYNVSYTPFLENGINTGVINMAVEVTPQVQAIQQRDFTIAEKSRLEEILRSSEQRLQSILETMAEGVCVVDRNGKVTYSNPMAKQILGVSELQLRERTYNDPHWQNFRIDGSPLPVEEHPMYCMLQTGKPVFNYEIALQAPGREPFYICVNAVPIFDSAGEVTGGIGTFLDVTSRRMIMQGKDDFISIASHELKNPVTALKGSLQLLQRSHHKLSAEVRTKLLDQSFKSLEKLSGLITDLLDTSRLEQGHLKLDKKHIILSQLFDDCCADLIKQTSQKIIFEGDDSLTVEADMQQVGQVLVNFITNAIKYAPESEQIVIKISQCNDEEIKISVIDKGPGISKEKIDHLFKRYYRTDYSGQKFTGLGLGLYISAEIIKNHGGKVGVESDAATGTEFWFTLPYNK